MLKVCRCRLIIHRYIFTVFFFLSLFSVSLQSSYFEFFCSCFFLVFLLFVFSNWKDRNRKYNQKKKKKLYLCVVDVLFHFFVLFCFFFTWRKKKHIKNVTPSIFLRKSENDVIYLFLCLLLCFLAFFFSLTWIF